MSAKPGRSSLAAVMAVVIMTLVGACAAPPLKLYTLGIPSTAADAAPLGRKSVVIEVRRVSIPDYLDNQDILVRDGNTLIRMRRGRWASRLSTSATRLLTGLLAERRPDALITDQPPVEPATYQIFITISTLDVTSSGEATLVADWSVVPRNRRLPIRRSRARLSVTGSVATETDVVLLDQALLQKLADAIDLAGLR